MLFVFNFVTTRKKASRVTTSMSVTHFHLLLRYSKSCFITSSKGISYPEYPLLDGGYYNNTSSAQFIYPEKRTVEVTSLVKAWTTRDTRDTREAQGNQPCRHIRIHRVQSGQALNIYLGPLIRTIAQHAIQVFFCPLLVDTDKQSGNAKWISYNVGATLTPPPWMSA